MISIHVVGAERVRDRVSGGREVSYTEKKRNLVNQFFDWQPSSIWWSSSPPPWGSTPSSSLNIVAIRALALVGKINK